jgi:hypothetical protein
MSDFHTNLQSLNIGMGENNYDRYKLIALYKKEIGSSPKRGTAIAVIVQAIVDHRRGQ